MYGDPCIKIAYTCSTWRETNILDLWDFAQWIIMYKNGRKNGLQSEGCNAKRIPLLHFEFGRLQAEECVTSNMRS